MSRPARDRTIYTIGHSTLTFDAFVERLKAFEIRILADIRSFPGSRRLPHFNRENLKKDLPGAGAVYVNIAGNAYPVTAVMAVPADPNSTAPAQDLAYVNFVMPAGLVTDPTVTNPTVPVMVGTGTRLAAAFTVNLAALPATAGQ